MDYWIMILILIYIYIFFYGYHDIFFILCVHCTLGISTDSFI